MGFTQLGDEVLCVNFLPVSSFGFPTDEFSLVSTIVIKLYSLFFSEVFKVNDTEQSMTSDINAPLSRAARVIRVVFIRATFMV